MNHVPLPILRWIRRALIGCSLLFLAACLFVALVLGYGYGSGGAYGCNLLIAGICILHLSFEVYSSLSLFKRFPVAATLVSLSAVLLCAFIAIEPTGVYRSPYILLIIALIFVAEALNAFAGASVLMILVFGYILNLLGLFKAVVDPTFGAAAIALGTAAAVFGYIFWRRFYIRPEDADRMTTTLAASLQDEKNKSGIILQAIEDGVVLLDANKTIQLFNPAASKITGWPANEATALDFHTVFHLVDDKNADYTEEANPFNRVYQEKHTIRDNRATLVSRSDKRISINVSLSPLLDPNGNINGAVAVFRDVSEERSEEQRRAEFISTASHEMRTPVAAIEGYLALALNDKVSTIDVKARGFLEKAHESTQHLGKLFQDLLTSAKAEDGRLTSHPVVVEMGEFLEKLTDDLRFSAEKKGLHMEFLLGTAGQVIDASVNTEAGGKVIRPFYYVHVDADRLREVITNLFDNAVKYTESGNISIGLTGNDEVVQFYVKDTGPGIPREDIPHLFQKFYRVDSSATRTIGGTGLGLFICRKIVELYNGRIWVESEINTGSTFFINLPRLNGQKADQLRLEEAKSASPLSGTSV